MKLQLCLEMLVGMMLSLLIVLSLLQAFHYARSSFASTSLTLARIANCTFRYLSRLVVV